MSATVRPDERVDPEISNATSCGVLIFSSHNLAFVNSDRPGSMYRRMHAKLNRPIVQLVKLGPRVPARAHIRRRMPPLDLEGRAVAGDAPECPELHYVARRR